MGDIRSLAGAAFSSVRGVVSTDAAVDTQCRPDDIQAAGYPAPDYADLFERAPLGYLLLDTCGCIVRINRRGAAVLGWDAAWLVGKPFSRWVANNDKQLFHAHREQLRDTVRCFSRELRVKNRQGRLVNLRLESEREMDAVGTVTGCRCIMIDISDEQQSARQLRQLQSQLAHLARLRTAGEMASSLAHELNQPLGTVVLNCEAALRLLNAGKGQDYEFAESLTQATEAASFASEVVRHLRDFLRNPDERHKVCALADLVQDVTALIATDARDNEVELRIDIDTDMPSVRVNPVQIEQVLVNLAHNGIEAICGSRERGSARLEITVSTLSPDRIQVSVVDTGPGLKSDQLDRVFGAFYTTKRDGMGMGLSISRTIIDAHGGKLWATSDSDGASLHFTLPTVAGASNGH
jgi:two-component system sensor kinase FixL